MSGTQIAPILRLARRGDTTYQMQPRAPDAEPERVDTTKTDWELRGAAPLAESTALGFACEAIGLLGRIASLGANGSHGLPRTNADKRRAVEILLRDPEWSQWSDREIARRACVHHQMVGAMRRELSGGIIQIAPPRLARRGVRADPAGPLRHGEAGHH